MEDVRRVDETRGKEATRKGTAERRVTEGGIRLVTSGLENDSAPTLVLWVLCCQPSPFTSPPYGSFRSPTCHGPPPAPKAEEKGREGNPGRWDGGTNGKG